jgi:ABC-type branched-subunit amino acid transport system substrate-binding protein
MTTRRELLALAALSTPLARTFAQSGPIRIGEINSYSTIPQFTIPYRMGWQLAVEEANAAGGVLGRRIDVISRDDAGKPEDAIRLATELVANEKVALLAGTFLSNVGLAVADFALRSKVLFVAAEPLTDALVWEKGNRYTFRLRPSTYMQSGMLVEEAAKLPAKRWAIIAPNYEYGQSAVASFKALLKARRPDVEFVAEQWPALGKLEAASTVQAIIAARPEAIFNVTFGADLPRLVREGNLRGLFPRVPVVSLLSGEPEYLDVLKDETPKGWIVTGYQAPQRQPSPGLGRWVLDLHGDLRGAEEGEVDRHREADRGDARARMDDAVRSGRVPARRSPVDDGSVRRQARRARRPRDDGRLALRRRGEVPARRRRGCQAPPRRSAEVTPAAAGPPDSTWT